MIGILFLIITFLFFRKYYDRIKAIIANIKESINDLDNALSVYETL